MKKPTAKKENQVSKPPKQKISNKISFPIVGNSLSAEGLDSWLKRKNKSLIK